MGFQYVLPGCLAQGSAPQANVDLPFDVLVLCAMEFQPPSFNYPSVKVLHVPLDDSGPPTRAEVHLALLAAHRVYSYLRQGRRVLTTCAMGRNRSGLVNGLALVEYGYSSVHAVELIRQARRNALTNVHFVEVIYARAAQLGRRDSVAAIS